MRLFFTQEQSYTFPSGFRHSRVPLQIGHFLRLTLIFLTFTVSLLSLIVPLGTQDLLGAAASDQLVAGAAPVVVTAGVTGAVVAGAGVVGGAVAGGGDVVTGVAVAVDDGVLVGLTVGVAAGVTRVVVLGVARGEADGTTRGRAGLRVGVTTAARDEPGLLAGSLVNDDGLSDGEPSRSDGVTSWLFTLGES